MRRGGGDGARRRRWWTGRAAAAASRHPTSQQPAAGAQPEQQQQPAPNQQPGTPQRTLERGDDGVVGGGEDGEALGPRSRHGVEKVEAPLLRQPHQQPQVGLPAGDVEEAALLAGRRRRRRRAAVFAPAVAAAVAAAAALAALAREGSPSAAAALRLAALLPLSLQGRQPRQLQLGAERGSHCPAQGTFTRRKHPASGWRVSLASTQERAGTPSPPSAATAPGGWAAPAPRRRWPARTPQPPGAAVQLSGAAGRCMPPCGPRRGPWLLRSGECCVAGTRLPPLTTHTESRAGRHATALQRTGRPLYVCLLPPASLDERFRSKRAARL